MIIYKIIILWGRLARYTQLSWHVLVLAKHPGVAWTSGLLNTADQMTEYQASKQARIDNEAGRLASLRANESLPLVSAQVSRLVAWLAYVPTKASPW